MISLKRTFFIPLSMLACCVALIVSCYTPSKPAPAKKRKPLRRKWGSQYKKISRDAISWIVDGKVDDAIERANAYLDEHPDDLESYYVLAVAHAQENRISKAMQYVKKSVELGLPFERFLAGPRDLLKPLTNSLAFKRFAQKHAVELLHGPLLGCLTDSSAKFWVRTWHEVPVSVVVRSAASDGKEIARSPAVKTRRDTDFTAVMSVDGLQPNTTYTYELIVDGKQQPKTWAFRTFPPAGSKARFQVGFGGGAGYTPQHERMWNTITSHKLPAFLLLGDNVYIDHPIQPEVQQYCYYRRQSRPEYRQFSADTAIFAVWDDHDFSVNDGWGGPDIDQPAWKRAVWRIFRDNWNNPYYGGGVRNRGDWFDMTIADVDFFLLDSRYYRTDPRIPNPSMLGPLQKRWFLDKLKNSKATFKVLASPVPWALGTKPGSRDTWDGYAAEREEIFSFIEKNKINGVVLISADRHRSDVWKISRSNGYDFYEFESSKLTNIHTHRIMKGALFGYNKKCSFGILTFDTTMADPEVTYQIYNIDDELIHTQKVRLTELTHPN